MSVRDYVFHEEPGITLYCGDCQDIYVGMDADRLITDPPYGFGAYATDRAELVPSIISRAAPTAVTRAVFGYPEVLIGWLMESGFRVTEWVTWWPTNKMSARTALLPRESEAIAIIGDVPGAQRLLRPRSLDSTGRAIAALRGNGVHACRMGDVWRDPSPGAGFNRHLRQHPNEKPLSLMSRLVDLCTNRGDVVLDPFAGSGTTLMAAKNLGRRAIGIEIEPRYCEIAVKRLRQEVLPLMEALA